MSEHYIRPPFEWIIDYYKVPACIGRDVKIGGKLGTITKDMGTYIGVVLHSDEKKICYPYHPTSEVEYLDTMTDIAKFKVKNSRSKQRYLDYLEADSSLSFGEWIKLK